MAEYLIQGETLTYIADQIRSRTGSNNLISPTDMGSQVQLVYAKGYTNGKIAITEGEKRDETNVTESVDVESRSVDVEIESGYYAKGILRTVDVRSVYNAGMSNGAEQGYSYGYEDGHNDGYDAGYTEGYNDGLAAGGGGGGDEPYDPTTVWQINDVPNTEDLPSTVSSMCVISFTSNGTSYAGIFGSWIGLSGVVKKAAIRYAFDDGTYITVWDLTAGWANEAYKTITIHEEITDQTLLDWLTANATLISSGGGGGGEEEELDAMALSIILDQTQSPSVRVFNKNLDHQYGYPVEIYGQRYDYNYYTFDDYIETEVSSPSSNPFTISALNNTSLYAYLYVVASDERNGETYYEWLEVPPYGDNSVDFVSQLSGGQACEWLITILGVRFTKYAIEV
jgi:hypothetical protein